MSDEIKHTPTPWRICPTRKFMIQARMPIMFGPRKHWEEVANLVAYREDWYCSNHKANAEFIVRAVNAHDTLMAALRECLAVFEAREVCECVPNEITCDNCAAMDSARRAIAKGESKC